MPEEATKPAEGYKYHRVLLKLSGEALMGDNGYGIDPKVIDDLAEQIKHIVDDGVIDSRVEVSERIEHKVVREGPWGSHVLDGHAELHGFSGPDPYRHDA